MAVRKRRVADQGDPEEKERETNARLEELDRLKSDFAANVSHELKSPLTSIIGAASTIRRKGPGMDPGQLAGFVEMIERQANRLLRTIEDVMVASRIDSGLQRMRRELIDLRAEVEAVVDEVRTASLGKDREITVVTRPEKPQVWGDVRALRSIATKLIENALKCSEAPSKVAVVLTETPDEARLEVSDEGSGMSPEEIEVVFDRFRQADTSTTRKVEGLGLGLFVVKSLAEAHGGRVDVRSEPGAGSTFTVVLPKRSSDRGRLFGDEG